MSSISFTDSSGSVALRLCLAVSGNEMEGSFMDPRTLSPGPPSRARREPPRGIPVGTMAAAHGHGCSQSLTGRSNRLAAVEDSLGGFPVVARAHETPGGDPPTRHVTFPSARPSEIIYGMAVGDGRKGP